MEIRKIRYDDLEDIRVFTDQWIGAGYYDFKQLENILELSKSQDENCSFVACDGNKIVGVRLTYAPGKWWKEHKSISPHSWEVIPEQVAYFKSLFISDEYQGRGLGKQLSAKSLEVVKKLNGKAVICHSWLESPHNSSQRYLEKMQFKKLKDWPKFWKEIDYSCTRCGKPCLCTASEMIYYL